MTNNPTSQETELNILRKATIMITRREGREFGNYEEIRKCDDCLVRAVSDRGQIFIDVGSEALPGRWFDFREVAKVLSYSSETEKMTLDAQVTMLLEKTRSLSLEFKSNPSGFAKRMDDYATLRTQSLKDMLINNRPRDV